MSPCNLNRRTIVIQISFKDVGILLQKSEIVQVSTVILSMNMVNLAPDGTIRLRPDTSLLSL